MSTQAKVKSVEVIEAFRASLVVFISKARPALEEVGEEVTRTRLWLESQRRVELESALRKRTRELEEAQQALFSARIASLRDASTAEMEAVHRAKRAFDATQEKLATVRRWNRDFPSRSEPLLKQLEKLRSVLYQDLPHAAQLLSEILKSLEDYAGIAAPLDVGSGGGSGGSSGNPESSPPIVAGAEPIKESSKTNLVTSSDVIAFSDVNHNMAADVIAFSDVNHNMPADVIHNSKSKDDSSSTVIDSSNVKHGTSDVVIESPDVVIASSKSKDREPGIVIETSIDVFHISKNVNESSPSKQE